MKKIQKKDKRNLLEKEIDDLTIHMHTLKKDSPEYKKAGENVKTLREALATVEKPDHSLKIALISAAVMLGQTAVVVGVDQIKVISRAAINFIAKGRVR